MTRCPAFAGSICAVCVSADPNDGLLVQFACYSLLRFFGLPPSALPRIDPWTLGAKQDPLPEAYEAEIASQVAQGAGEDAARCGLLDIAVVTIGAAFVGAFAASLVVSDLLRLLHGGELRSGARRPPSPREPSGSAEHLPQCSYSRFHERPAPLRHSGAGGNRRGS